MPEGMNLFQALQGGKRLLIYLHDSPDPDAMAAGWLLKHIGESLGLEAVVLYGGILGRAENRAMVRVLDVPLLPLEQARLTHRKDDLHALVDTQPGAGNNSFPHEELEAHVVVDHHPSHSKIQARFNDVRLDQGCSTTLVLQHFESLGLELTPPLATAGLCHVDPLGFDPALERGALEDGERFLRRAVIERESRRHNRRRAAPRPAPDCGEATPSSSPIAELDVVQREQQLTTGPRGPAPEPRDSLRRELGLVQTQP